MAAQQEEEMEMLLLLPSSGLPQLADPDVSSGSAQRARARWARGGLCRLARRFLRKRPGKISMRHLCRDPLFDSPTAKMLYTLPTKRLPNRCNDYMGVW